MPGQSPAAADIVQLLGLEPHPEGGHFRETFRDQGGLAGRSHSSAIYYLLAAGEVSAWHRIDAAELWHFYAGDPLVLTLCAKGGAVLTQLLGPDLASGARPQAVVPAGVWQSAKSCGAWTLVGCTVAPGFSFEGFEMAPLDWMPQADRA